jgi:hypothetical protein
MLYNDVILIIPMAAPHVRAQRALARTADRAVGTEERGRRCATDAAQMFGPNVLRDVVLLACVVAHYI